MIVVGGKKGAVYCCPKYKSSYYLSVSSGEARGDYVSNSQHQSLLLPLDRVVT